MKLAKDFRDEALNALNGRWGLAVGGGLIATLLGGGSAGFSGGSASGRGASSGGSSEALPDGVYTFFFIMLAVLFVISLVFSFIGSAVRLGYIQFCLNYLSNTTQPNINDIFSRFKIIMKAFGLQIVISVFTFLWTLLFIIPGIIAAYSYTMAPYIMAENPEIGIMDAIRQSKEMMNGNKWRFFCLQISFIGWSLLAIFTCGIGFLWLNPYIAVANAAFYNEISGNNIRRYENPDNYFSPDGSYSPNNNYSWNTNSPDSYYPQNNNTPNSNGSQTSYSQTSYSPDSYYPQNNNQQDGNNSQDNSSTR